MWIPFWPTKPETDEMFTMAPRPAFSMSGMACFIPRKTPLALTSMSRSHADTLKVSGSKVPLMPALFTRMSSLPKLDRVAAIASCQAASLVTSRRTNRPASPRPSATFRPSASSTSATTTLAPSLAKMLTSLCPMPRAPPVTSATLPSSLICLSLQNRFYRCVAETCSPPAHVLRLGSGDSQKKHAAFPDLRLGPGPAAVALRHLADDGQTDSRARILLLEVQALEDAEDPVVILHVEAHAPIGHRDHDVVSLSRRANGDAPPALRAELDGIGKEVGQRLPEPVPLSHDLGDREIFRHRELTLLKLGRVSLEELIHERLQGHWSSFGRAVLDPSIAEEVVDELPHLAGRAPDRREISPPRVIEAIPVLLLHRVRISRHGAQRGLEIVRHHGGKGVELAIGRFELTGAFLHPLLELGGLPRDLLVEPRLRDRDGKLRGNFLRDRDLLGGKVRPLPANADRPDKLTARHHGDDHVRVHARGKEGFGMGARRQRMHVDHLWLAPPQALDVPGERQRIADAGPEMHAMASHRGQPLDFPRLEVEHVHDGPRHSQQVPQPLEHRLRDGHRRLLGDDGAVDLVQDSQALRLLGERLPGHGVVYGDGGLIRESLQERDVLRGEDPGRGAAHGEHADDLASRPQGYREAGDDADRGVPLANLGGELEAVVAPDVAGPDGTPLDGRPPDEPDTRGHDFTHSPIFLGATAQGDGPQRAVRPREPDGRAVHGQQPENALRDPITHGGQIQGLADESADPSQLEGLVLLLHQLGATSRVLEEENGLVAEDG